MFSRVPKSRGAERSRVRVLSPFIINTQSFSNGKQHTSLRIFTSNVRGVVKNWDAIKQLNLKKYDILLFNEIWQIREFECLQINEFKLANVTQRVNSRGGGCLVFIRNNIAYDKFESPNIEAVIETSSIIINNTVITSIYRPPSGCKRVFTQELVS